MALVGAAAGRVVRDKINGDRPSCAARWGHAQFWLAAKPDRRALGVRLGARTQRERARGDRERRAADRNPCELTGFESQSVVAVWSRGKDGRAVTLRCDPHERPWPPTHPQRASTRNAYGADRGRSGRCRRLGYLWARPTDRARRA